MSKSYIIYRGKLFVELLQIKRMIYGLLKDAVPRIKVVNVDPNAENAYKDSAQPSEETEEEKVPVIEVTNASVQPRAMMVHRQDAPVKSEMLVKINI